MKQWIDKDGRELAEFPKGAYIRIKTEDAIVVIIEHRPLDNGDFDQSIRYFGPFEHAAEQREFMADAIRRYNIGGARQQEIIDGIMKWRRFDEAGAPT